MIQEQTMPRADQAPPAVEPVRPATVESVRPATVEPVRPAANWQLRIRHVTGSRYAGYAHASYNEARLTPLTLPWQTTLSSQVEITPPASTIYRYTDYWATNVVAFDLNRPHQQLRVTATSLVECAAPPRPGSAAPWSVLRDHRVRDEYAELLAASGRTTLDAELTERAAAIAGTLPPADAAIAIADWVRANVAYVPGSTGVEGGAREAWHLRKGVCQDIAHLTIGMLRSIGVPTRYVSGYLHPQADAEPGDTFAGQSHAWVEWWCGDWVPFDPTNGVEVGPQHVTVARGRDYDDVAPLKGVYHGAPSSQLGVTVEITRIR